MLDNDNVQQTLDAVARRERRRIRVLAFLAIALWVLAALFIPAVFLPLAAKIMKQIQLVQQEIASQQTTPLLDLPRLVQEGFTVAMIIGGAALLTALLASICTVALALTVRRVTLRQVSDSLAEISRQLRELKGAK